MSQVRTARSIDSRHALGVARRRACVAILLCAGIIGGCAQGSVRSSSPGPAVAAAEAASDPAYKLDAGDKLRVIVFGEMDLGGEFEVDGSGFIRLPLIGQIRAAGLAVDEFENSMKSALEPNYLTNARVSVEVINYRPFYILGQVNQPGEYPYVNGMSVLTAVALAGGYTYRASESTCTSAGGVPSEETPAPANQGTRVQPGDIITVRERFF